MVVLRKHIEVHGRPTAAVFRSKPNTHQDQVVQIQIQKYSPVQIQVKIQMQIQMKQAHKLQDAQAEKLTSLQVDKLSS